MGGRDHYHITAYVDDSVQSAFSTPDYRVVEERNRLIAKWTTEAKHCTVDGIPYPKKGARDEQRTVEKTEKTKTVIDAQAAADSVGDGANGAGASQMGKQDHRDATRESGGGAQEARNAQPMTTRAQIVEAFRARIENGLTIADNAEEMLSELNSSQRACIAAELLPALVEKAKHYARKNPRAEGYKIKGDALDLIATALGVGQTNINTAERLKFSQPDLYAQVVDGKLNLARALRLFQGKPDAPPLKAGRKPKDAPPKRIMPKIFSKYFIERRGGHAKRLMVDGLSRINGICMGLATLDAALLNAVLTDDERSMWIDLARQESLALREFAVNLKDTERYGQEGTTESSQQDQGSEGTGG
jgi:hypothetical protein